MTDTLRFRAAIRARLGLDLGDEKLGELGELLRARLRAARVGPDAYLAGLERGADPAEPGALARVLTVGETYFFRHAEQLHALRELVLHGREAPARVLSAGCASGEEAYTIAIFAEGTRATVLGVDVNPDALARARRGRYGAWALRDTPAEARRRWFVAEGGDFVVDPSIRAAVTFAEKNLVIDDPDLWRPGAFDAVFCRNVIMYFTPEQARAVIARLAGALVPGGTLFLGHAETLRGLSDDFDLCHTHGTFYYRRKDERAVAQVPVAPPAPLASSWVETVQRAAERIQGLARTGPPPAPPPPARPDPARALELLAAERFADALDQLGAARHGEDAETLLLRAALLTHAGRLAAAEEACRELLARGERAAGAHYLLALCREAAGDRQAALAHDRSAAELDPAFAMPRLHLGLLLRRAGDREGARRALGDALPLLAGEEPSRLVLFGGGFGRDALLSMCAAELRAAGARP